LRAAGILELVQCIVDRDFLYKYERWIVSFAAKALFLHEFFHHAVEVSCSRLEYPFSTTLPNWGTDQYSRYFNDRIGSYAEEAMANAYLARSIDRYYRESPITDYAVAKHGLLKAMDYQPRRITSSDIF
jgi:hypothetical protein